MSTSQINASSALAASTENGLMDASISSPAKMAREKKLLEIFLEQLQTVAMSILILALLIYLLQTFAVMLQQLLIALFLVYLILPVRNWLSRYRLSSVMTYSIILLGVLVIGWILALVVQESLSDFNRKWPVYQKNLGAALSQGAEWIPGVNEEQLKKIVVGSDFSEQESVQFLREAMLRLLDFSGQLFIVLVYVAFLLAEAVTMNRRLRHSFEEPRATDLMVMLHRINNSISKYISVKTLVSLMVGVSTTLVLWAFGVDYAILWGIIAFVLNYIPYIGAVIAVVFPATLAILQTGNPILGLTILVLLNVIHSIIGYWLEPVLMGDRLDLSPLVVIVALAFWATVWGVVGMIMAIPLMVSIKIVLENIPATRPLAILLSNVRQKEKVA